MSSRWDRGTDTRGAALVLVALLLLVLSVFASAAVSCLGSSLNADTGWARETFVFYVAEAARAHAIARVKAGVSSHVSGILLLQDDTGTGCGEYSYAITDITLPEQNQRRRVQVSAYQPDEATAAAQYHATFYMEENGGSWAVVSYMEDT